jgi:hypothetical protein
LKTFILTRILKLFPDSKYTLEGGFIFKNHITVKTGFTTQSVKTLQNQWSTNHQKSTSSFSSSSSEENIEESLSSTDSSSASSCEGHSFNGHQQSKLDEDRIIEQALLNMMASDSTALFTIDLNRLQVLRPTTVFNKVIQRIEDRSHRLSVHLRAKDPLKLTLKVNAPPDVTMVVFYVNKRCYTYNWYAFKALTLSEEKTKSDPNIKSILSTDAVRECKKIYDEEQTEQQQQTSSLSSYGSNKINITESDLEDIFSDLGKNEKIREAMLNDECDPYSWIPCGNPDDDIKVKMVGYKERGSLVPLMIDLTQLEEPKSNTKNYSQDDSEEESSEEEDTLEYNGESCKFRKFKREASLFIVFTPLPCSSNDNNGCFGDEEVGGLTCDDNDDDEDDLKRKQESSLSSYYSAQLKNHIAFSYSECLRRHIVTTPTSNINKNINQHINHHPQQ